MKTIKFLLAGLIVFSLAACDRDPFPLQFGYFDPVWVDIDNSNSHTPNDEVELYIQVNTTDPDPDDQFIREWELSYFVNDNYAGLIDGDENILTNTLNIEAIIGIYNLNFPGPEPFSRAMSFLFDSGQLTTGAHKSKNTTILFWNKVEFLTIWLLGRYSWHFNRI